MSEPSDATVREAIAAQGDPELSALTAGESSFVLREASAQGDRFSLYHVILVEVPHPMSVMLAVDEDRTVVTSERPEVVAEIVDADPALREPETVWDLIRGGPMNGRLEAASADAGTYAFTVRDDATDALSRWRFTLATRRRGARPLMAEREHVRTQQPEVAAPSQSVAAPALPRLSLTTEAVLSLQRSAGNAAATRWLQRVKADGSIDDPAEMEKTRAVGSDVDADTRKKAMDGLAAAPRSKEILDDIKKLRGDLAFPMKWSNQGTFHGAGTISLDRNTNYEDWFAGMAHEIVHLHTFLAGKAADIKTMTREDFVKAKMEDEINAHAASYVALMQSGKETAPAKGYAEFRTHLKTALPDALKNKDWPAIETSAKKWLEERYKTDASWTTSNTHENYYDYWGKAWDKEHAKKTP